MPTSTPLTSISIAMQALLIAWLASGISPVSAQDPPLPNPDVIVGDLPNVKSWGTSADGTISAFSIATTSCNVGTDELEWQAETTAHPVIAQNAYRLKEGRFEQVGMSWLKHGFTALQETLCGDCIASGTGRKLGVGCSDPYWAELNGGGSSHDLGPRSGVFDPAAGAFEYPYVSSPVPSEDKITRRLQVKNLDLEPALNPGARYFVEGQYVTADDAVAGNGANNASYREVFVGRDGAQFILRTRFDHPTERKRPAIEAWAAADPAVRLYRVNVPDGGLLNLALRTTAGAGGSSHTELALHNLSSTRAVGSLTLKVPGGGISGVGFRDVDYHSGEPYSTVDWSHETAGERLTWKTETYNQNEHANAIRWGTMYSFWFDSQAAPASAEIGLFTPGVPATVTVDLTAGGGGGGAAVDPAGGDRPWAVEVEGGVDLGTIDAARPGRFQVYCLPGVKRQLGRVESSSARLAARAESFAKGDVQGWTIWVAKAPDAKHGHFETLITLITDVPGDRAVQMRAFGTLE